MLVNLRVECKLSRNPACFDCNERKEAHTFIVRTQFHSMEDLLHHSARKFEDCRPYIDAHFRTYDTRMTNVAYTIAIDTMLGPQVVVPPVQEGEKKRKTSE